jgi:hypothetical protein
VHGAGNHGYQIYNNTVVAGFGDPAMFEQGADSRASTIDFVNNILVNTGRGSWRAPGGCRFDHNLCWGGTPDLGDPHALLADPLLVAPGDSVDGLRLAAGSPAFGAGLVVEANGGRDYWGRPVRANEPVNVGADNRQPPR